MRGGEKPAEIKGGIAGLAFAVTPASLHGPHSEAALCESSILCSQHPFTKRHKCSAHLKETLPLCTGAHKGLAGLPPQSGVLQDTLMAFKLWLPKLGFSGAVPA